MQKIIYVINKIEYERLLSVCKTRREMQGISKSRMAEMCNVTRQSIYNFENNVGGENLDMLTKYGLALDSDEIFYTMEHNLYERKEINL